MKFTQHFKGYHHENYIMESPSRIAPSSLGIWIRILAETSPHRPLPAEDVVLAQDPPYGRVGWEEIYGKNSKIHRMICLKEVAQVKIPELS